MLDMTQGNPSKLILRFAFPMILGNIFQQVYNLVDTIVVGKFIGADALAAVGSSFSIIVFITSIIIGLAMGAGIILAQYYGAKEFEKFRRKYNYFNYFYWDSNYYINAYINYRNRLNT